MKKTLLALSVTGALVSAAGAAPQVEVYGLLDTGVSYVHTDADIAGVADTDTFSMTNAQEFGSRWGLRGVEDLGNGYKVGFTLESGIESDTGALDTKQGGKLFGREAHLNISGPFGKVWMGLMPVFGSVLGENGLFRAIDPLFANYTQGLGSGFASASMWTRVDNAFAYRTPTFGALTGYAMYSLKMNTSAGEEGKADADRYASLAARYVNAGLEAVLVADTTLYGNARTGANAHEDDGMTVTLGGNYTFDNGFKVIVFGQYFKDQELNVYARGGVAKTGIINLVHGYGFVDGWGASLGVNYPLAGGVIKGQLSYRDMDNDADVDFTRLSVAAGYDYPVSKRTALYVMAGYSQEKVEDNKAKTDATPNGYELTAGIVHRF